MGVIVCPGELRLKFNIVVVKLLICAWLFVTPWTGVHQAFLSLTISLSLLKLMSFESMMPSNHLILSHPFLFLPSIFPSIKVLSNQSAHHIRWPNYWSYNFSISPSNEYSGCISFRIDWLVGYSCSPRRLSRVFSSTTVWKHQFFSTQPSLWFNWHIHTGLLENHSFDYRTIYFLFVVESLSHVWLFVTPWTAAHQASLSITNSWSLLKLTSIELVIVSNQLILCCPLLLLPSIFPSISIFSSESVLRIRWPKYWSFSFSISSSNIQDWFPLRWTGSISL